MPLDALVVLCPLLPGASASRAPKPSGASEGAGGAARTAGSLGGAVRAPKPSGAYASEGAGGAARTAGSLPKMSGAYASAGAGGAARTAGSLPKPSGAYASEGAGGAARTAGCLAWWCCAGPPNPLGRTPSGWRAAQLVPLDALVVLCPLYRHRSKAQGPTSA